MNIENYYSILEWRGEDPCKRDSLSDKEFGRKIYEQDIALGKTVWVDHIISDFMSYICHHDPLLFLLGGQSIGCNDVMMAVLFILNVSTILATLTASLGLYAMPSSRQFASIGCAAFNGIMMCACQLKWRKFQSGSSNTKESSVIPHHEGASVTLFVVCTMSLAYYFLVDEVGFFAWFANIYVMQFVFAYMFELSAFCLTFLIGWRRDHQMMRLIPNYLQDGSVSDFSLPKCVYYVTYQDYEEWAQSQQSSEYELQLQEPLLNVL